MTRALVAALAGLLHLALLVPYLGASLLAPTPAVVGLLVLWLALAVALVAVERRRGALCLLVPLAGLGLWFAVVTAGEQLLGWTA